MHLRWWSRCRSRREPRAEFMHSNGCCAISGWIRSRVWLRCCGSSLMNCDRYLKETSTGIRKGHDFVATRNKHSWWRSQWQAIIPQFIPLGFYFWLTGKADRWKDRDFAKGQRERFSVYNQDRDIAKNFYYRILWLIKREATHKHCSIEQFLRTGAIQTRRHGWISCAIINWPRLSDKYALDLHLFL